MQRVSVVNLMPCAHMAQVLTRPLPDYALQHVFAQHGVVEYVRLQRDKRYGLVQVTARLLPCLMDMFGIESDGTCDILGLMGPSHLIIPRFQLTLHLP